MVEFDRRYATFQEMKKMKMWRVCLVRLNYVSYDYIVDLSIW